MSVILAFLWMEPTDVAKVESKAIVLLLYCDKDGHFKEVKSCARFLSVGTVSKADADDHLKCLGEVLSSLEVENVSGQSSILASMPVLVGGGALVIIAQQSSIRTNLCHSIPLIYWSRCFAHHLELASKNGSVKNF